MGRILVTGATSKLGRAVVDRLLAGGARVRVLTRRRAPDGPSFVEWASGDLVTGHGIDRAVDGADVVVHCATTNGRRDVPAGAHLAAAAQRAGVRHLVYVSIVGADRIPLGYYRAKVEVERRLADGGLPHTVVRATQFHELIAQLFSAQRRLPALFVPTGMAFQPVAVADVAARLAELASGPPLGRVPDLGGPEIRPLVDLAEVYRRSVDDRRCVVPLAVPGRVAQAYRSGHQLAPENAAGTITFEQFVAASRGAGSAT